MSDWTSEYLTLLEDCEKRSERLDEWSLSSIDSLGKQIARGVHPTKKQVEKLDEIWTRATERG